MIARVSHVHGLFEHMETAVPVLQESVDQIQGLAGFEGAYLLVDRAGSRIIAMDFWNDPADLDTSGHVARELLTTAAESVGAEVSIETHTFEVLLEV